MPPIIHQLQNAESVLSQVSILRNLKNETIGHDQRKETWVRWGIIPILAQVLALRQSNSKDVATSELNGASDQSSSKPKSEQDEACLQAVIVLGSLAQGSSSSGLKINLTACKRLMKLYLYRRPGFPLPHSCQRHPLKPSFYSVISRLPYLFSLAHSPHSQQRRRSTATPEST